MKWLITSFPARRTNIPGKIQKAMVALYAIFFRLIGIDFSLKRYFYINSITTEELTSHTKIPPIEVFVPAAKKDLESAMLTIKSVYTHSQNPIEKFTLVVPDSEIEIFRDKLSENSFTDVELLSEQQVLGELIIEKITDRFPKRSGWVLAEFLKFRFIYSSNARGILVIDADTILTNSRIWITDDNKQNIFPVLEYNRHYIDYLISIGVTMSCTNISFMSHYLLFQPAIYRELFATTSIYDEFSLLDTLTKNTSLDEHSPICICYEAYSHFALEKYPNRIKFSKWSNAQVSREKLFHNPNKYLLIGCKHFNSISSHSYL